MEYFRICKGQVAGKFWPGVLWLYTPTSIASASPFSPLRFNSGYSQLVQLLLPRLCYRIMANPYAPDAVVPFVSLLVVLLQNIVGTMFGRRKLVLLRMVSQLLASLKCKIP
jgi:hypothetical protein